MITRGHVQIELNCYYGNQMKITEEKGFFKHS